MSETRDLLFDEFRAAAEAVVRDRPAVDPEMVHEIFSEAATMLHNGLALDGLDAHDYRAVVAALCVDLVAADPGNALRARAVAMRGQPSDLHDAEAAAAACLTSASLLQV